MKPVVVFDFDGTLVDSNQLKYDAYFQILPVSEKVEDITRQVLSRIYEASRYVIIRELVDRLMEKGLMDIPRDTDPESLTDELARRYGKIVLEGAMTCPEIPGAGELLDRLHRTGTPLYLSSTTPEKPLNQIVTHRGWSGYFRKVFGYPRRKEDTLLEIMATEDIPAHRIMVVGDGESDRTSADRCGAAFACVKEKKLPWDLIIRFATEN